VFGVVISGGISVAIGGIAVPGVGVSAVPARVDMTPQVAISLFYVRRVFNPFLPSGLQLVSRV
jgi:hypothetical protein